MTARLLAMLLLLLVAATACAPRLAPPGPGLSAERLEQSRLTGNAFITRDGLELPYRVWQPAGSPDTPRAVVLALHGFNDYSNAFEAPGRYLAAKGFTVYAYDQRGFGEAPHRGLWAGTDVLVQDLFDLTATLRKHHPATPLYLLGESMGGAVVLVAMTKPSPPAVDGIVLSAPAVWARSTMPWYQRAALWIGVHTMPWATPSGRGLDIQASDNIEMLVGLARDPLFIKQTRIDALYGLVNLMDRALTAAPEVEGPALLLYGERDEVIPANPTFRLWRSLPRNGSAEPRPALYEDGWHLLLRDLEAAVVLNDIATWIADPQTPLPSGADNRARAALLNDGAEEHAVAAPAE